MKKTTSLQSRLSCEQKIVDHPSLTLLKLHVYNNLSSSYLTLLCLFGNSFVFISLFRSFDSKFFLTCTHMSASHFLSLLLHSIIVRFFVRSFVLLALQYSFIIRGITICFHRNIRLQAKMMLAVFQLSGKKIGSIKYTRNTYSQS